jgi:hypothetical protein
MGAVCQSMSRSRVGKYLGKHGRLAKIPSSFAARVFGMLVPFALIFSPVSFTIDYAYINCTYSHFVGALGLQVYL